MMERCCLSPNFTNAVSDAFCRLVGNIGDENSRAFFGKAQAAADAAVAAKAAEPEPEPEPAPVVKRRSSIFGKAKAAADAAVADSE